MNIVEVKHVGLKAVYQFQEPGSDLTRTEYTSGGFQFRRNTARLKIHIRREKLRPFRRKILRMLHTEKCHSMAFRLQQLFQRDRRDAIPSPIVVKFIGYKYIHAIVLRLQYSDESPFLPSHTAKFLTVEVLAARDKPIRPVIRTTDTYPYRR